jgi:2,4-dienoyl-CoA reductase-like NADH-dependent reductase (Old Yellow Enzyme family)
MGVAIWDDKFIPGWRELAKRVHQHGAKFFIQLGHDGRQGLALGKNGKLERVGPSAVSCPYVRETPRELSLEEIGEIRDKFVESAIRAQEAGIDGVSLHAAHGYLLTQFISSANKDGPIWWKPENRLRFLPSYQCHQEQVGRDYR